jgi:hypothetical protein
MLDGLCARAVSIEDVVSRGLPAAVLVANSAGRRVEYWYDW